MASSFRIGLIATTALAGLVPAAGFAQAFQGSFSSGNATRTQGSNSDVITIGTGGAGSTAIINWFPSEGVGPVNFLPSGRTATFVNDSTITDFTVINRVLPADLSRPVQFNGTVVSLVNGLPGGTVLFYSPGGIIAGPTAVFDVGSLVLTTLNPSLLQGGGFRLTGAAGSGAAVNVNAGALLTARATGGYVALVAPRVVMSGTVNVDGTAAYVAAEAVDLTISTGLYDIAVTAGTDTGNSVNAQPNAIVHDGQTVVRGDSSVAQRVVMAAVSKNDAITMLVGGSIVGSQANNVFVDGSDIVLSSGFPGAAGNGAITVPTDAQVNPVQIADLSITASSLALPLVAEAQRNATIAISSATASYASVSLLGRQNSLITVGGGSPTTAGTLTIAGDLTVDGGGVGAGRTATLGIRSSSRLDVAGNVLIDLTGRGSKTSINATGGSINLNLTNGRLNAGTVTLRADGVGYDTGDTVAGGAGQGGSVKINGQSAALGLTGDLLVSADGTGFGADPDNGFGGGYGGSVSLSLLGGSLNANAVSVSANALSSGLGDPELAQGGRAGLATVDFIGVSGSTLGSLTVDASFTGAGTRGRTGSAGTAAVGITANTGATIMVTGDVLIRADARGGDAALGQGGFASAGTARLTIDDDRLLLNAAGPGTLQRLTVSADAQGGAALGSSGFAGGTAAGGNASILVATGGVLGGLATDTRTPVITVSARGTGGGSFSEGGNGGTGSGGSAEITLDSTPPAIRPSQVNADEIRILADAVGGVGADIGQGAVAGSGGSAFAGLARLTADGQINLLTDGSSSSVELSAAAFGGAGGNVVNGRGAGIGGVAGSGGAAVGGTVELLVPGTLGTSGVFSFGQVNLAGDASAFGGAGGVAQDNPDAPGAAGGAGGSAEAGSVLAQVSGAVVQGDSDQFRVDLTASARGGQGGSGGQGASGALGGNGGVGGDGSAGVVVLEALGTGQITAGTVTLTANATGGDGASAGLGGFAGAGGNAAVDVDLPSLRLALADQAQLTTFQITARAIGQGGAGGTTADKGVLDAGANPGGAGGSAVGGSFTLEIGTGASLLAAGASFPLDIRTQAIGGAGGAGFAGGGDFSASDGGAGGAVTGGALRFDILGTYTGGGIDADGSIGGGDGGLGGTLAFEGITGPRGGNGGAGGSATGGLIDFHIGPTATLADNAAFYINNNARGGNGGNGGTPPSTTDPVFIAAVEANGPNFFFGDGGATGDIVGGSVTLRSENPANSIGVIAFSTDVQFGNLGQGSFVFVDPTTGAPQIGTNFGLGGSFGAPAPSLVELTGGTHNINSLNVSTGGALSLTSVSGATLTGSFANLSSSFDVLTVAAPVNLTDSIYLFGSNGLTVNSGVTAGNTVQLSTNGQLLINAPVIAPTINAFSGTIALNADLGDSNTALLTLETFNNAQLGGSPTGNWYLNQGSVPFLHAAQLVFRSSTTMTVADFDIFGTGATTPTLNALPSFPDLPAPVPTVVFAGESGLTVTGQLRLVSGSGDRLGLYSGGTLRIDTTAGSVENLGGLVYLRGASVEVATAATLASVNNQSDAFGRNAVLRDTIAVGSPGVVTGETVQLRVTDHGWVANTGVDGAYAGILVGQGGLSIDSRTSPGFLNASALANLTSFDGRGVDAPAAEFLLFGRQVVGGVAVTNDDFVASALSFTAPSVTADSYVNDCQLLGSCPLPPPPPSVDVGFQGDFTVDAGGATASRGSFIDRITIDGSNNATAVLTWRPYDINGVGTIDFLPAGNSGQFVGDVGLTNFTVINRVLPVDASRPIALNGLVTSRLFDNSVGGTVLFYSPGGVIVGSQGVLDVGSLVLTTLDTSVDPDSGAFIMRGLAGSGAEVNINAGAQLTAGANGGYVALVAPRVVMDGTVSVDGTAAYVAAEGVNLTIGTGLYDIAISDGTDTGNATNSQPEAIRHTGQTIVNGASSVPQRVVMTAVAKNDAITMLVGGAVVGSDVTNSFTAGSDIVLSAGVPGQAGNGAIRLLSGAAANLTAPADLTITASALALPLIAEAARNAALTIADGDSASYQSVSLLGRSSSLVRVGNADPASLDIAGNLLIDGGGTGRDRSATLTVGGGSRLSVTGNIGVDLSDTGTPTTNVDGLGGTIDVTLRSGARLSTGTLTLRADGAGYDTQDTVPGGAGQGGLVTMTATDATITLTGDLRLSADGTGFGMAAAAGGTGGQARLTLDAIVFTADGIDVHADGISRGIGDPETGPGGAGGTATVSIQGASDVSLLSLSASASFVGQGSRARSGAGGTALVDIGSKTGGAVVSVDAGVSVVADAVAGQSFSATGGDAQGGTATLSVTGSELLLTSFGEGFPGVSVSALGVGGDSAGPAGTSGGAGRGGTATLVVASGGLLGNRANQNVAPLVEVLAGGDGGFGIAAGPGAGTAGGLGRGGTAQVQVAGGTLGVQGLSLDANGTGGDGAASDVGAAGGRGGDGIGGSTRLEVLTGGLVRTLNRFSVSTVQLDATGAGGQGGGLRFPDGSNTPIALDAAAGAGGAGAGGTADFIIADGGTLTTAGLFNGVTTNIRGNVSAFGGAGGSAEHSPLGSGFAGGAGGSAQGGTATIGVTGLLDQGSQAIFNVNLSGRALAGDGGAGSEYAFFGVGGDGGNGGAAQAGHLAVGVSGTGVATLGAVDLNTSSQGGAGGTAALGGRGGAGGSATVDLNAPVTPALQLSASGSGRLTARIVRATSRAQGGAGGGTADPTDSSVTPGAGGDGGAARAGDVQLLVDPAAAVSFTGQVPVQGSPPRAIDITLDAIGGAGGAGYSLVAGLSGSSGGGGGAAQSGELLATIAGGFSASGVAATLHVTGGRGGDGGAAGFTGDPTVIGGAGGDGGAAIGAAANVQFLAGATVTLGALTIEAAQSGGNGGNGGAAPDPGNPDFINGVATFGASAYDFGRAGNGGDVTFSPINLASGVDGLALDTLRVVVSSSPAGPGIGYVATDGPTGPGIGVVAGSGGGVGGPTTTLQLDGRLDAASVLVAVGGTLDLLGNGGLAAQAAQLTSDFAGVRIATPTTAASSLTVFGPVVTIDATVSGDQVVTSAQQTIVNAAVDGRAISITSETIDLNATVGGGATEDLAFGIVNFFGPARLGGADPGPGVWYLSQADAPLLRARNLIFRAAGSLEVGDLTLSGPGAAQPNLNSLPGLTPSLVIAADGPISVTGQLLLSDAAGADLGVVSAQTLSVDPLAGGRIVNSGGNLYLRGTDIEVASAATLADVRNQPDASTRNDALRQAAPVPTADVLVGERVTLRAAGHAWVANSGFGTIYAGILTGAGGLDIDGRAAIAAGQVTADIGAIDALGAAAGPAEFIAFGRQLVGGIYTSNNAFFTNALSVGPNVSSSSFVNNCGLLTGCPPPLDVGFRGDFTVDAGGATATRGGFVDRITIDGGNNATAVLTWRPYDVNGVGTIDFLPSGNSGQFVGDIGLTGYTVINRVLPVDLTRPIALNGQITSRLFDGSVGGRIYFYAPGGVLVGSTASIDVGSLMLSAADPVLQPDGVTWRLDGAAADSFVTVDSGASITAANSVALVAPRVTMNGAVTVGGTAAYLAATDVDLKLNEASGDYAIGWGSSLNTAANATVISIDGTTTSTGAATSGLVIAAPTGFGNFGIDVGGSAIGSFGHPTAIYSTFGVFGGNFSIQYRDGVFGAGTPANLNLRLAQSDSRLIFGGGAVTLRPAAGGSTYAEVGGSGFVSVDVFTDATAPLQFNGDLRLGSNPFATNVPVTVSGNGSLSATGLIAFLTSGGLTIDSTVTAGTLLASSVGGNVTINGAVSGQSVDLATTGASFDVFGSISANASLSLSTGNSLYLDSAASLTSNGSISLGAGSAIDLLAAVGATTGLSLSAADITTGALSGASITLTGSGGGNFTVGALSATDSLTITGAAGVDIGGPVSGASISIAAPVTATDFIVTSPNPGGGDYSFARVIANGVIDIRGGAQTSASGLLSAQTITIDSLGAISLADLSSDGATSLTAEGSILVAGNITAPTLTLTTNAGLADPAWNVTLSGGLSLGALNVGTAGLLTVSQGLSLGGDVSIAAGAASLQSVAADGDVVVITDAAGSGVSVAGALAGRTIFLSGGPVSVSGAINGDTIGIEAAGGVSFGADATALGPVSITATGKVDLAGTTSGQSLTLSGQSLALGALVADPAGAIAITGTGGAVDLNGQVDGGSLTITASTAPVSLNAGIAVGALSVQATGTGSAIAINAPLTIPTGVEAQFSAEGPITASVDLATDGALRFSTGGLADPTLGTVSLAGVSSGGLTIQASGAVDVGGPLTAGGVFIENGGSQRFGGDITTDGLSLFGAGPVTVTGSIASGRTIINVDGDIAVSGGIIGDGRGGAAAQILLGSTSGSISVGGALDSGFVSLGAGAGTVGVGGAITADSFDANAQGVTLSGGLTVGGGATIGGATVTVGTPVTVGSLVVTGTGAGDISFAGAIDSPGAVSITGAQTLTLGGPLTAGSISLAGDTLNLGDLTATAAGGGIALTAATPLTLSGAISGFSLNVNAGALTIDRAPDITDTLQVIAGGPISASVDLTAASITLISSGDRIALAGISSSGTTTLLAGGPISVTGPVGAGGLQVSSAGTVQFGGTVTLAGSANVIASGDLDLAAGLQAAATRISIGGSLTVGQDVGVTNLLDVFAGGTASFGGNVSAGSFSLSTNGGDASIAGAATVAGTFSTSIAGALRTGAVTTATLIGQADGDIVLGSLTIGTATLDAGGTVSAGRVDGDALQIASIGDVTLAGPVTLTGAFTLVNSNGLTIGGDLAADSASIISTGTGSLAFGAVTITNALTIDSGGSLSAGQVNAGQVQAQLGAGASFAGLSSSGVLSLTTAGPLRVSGDLAGGDISLTANGSAGGIRVDGTTTAASLSAGAATDLVFGQAVSVSGTTDLGAGNDIRLAGGLTSGPASIGAGNALTIGQGLTIFGDLSAGAGGALSVTGAVRTTGLAALGAGSDLTLSGGLTADAAQLNAVGIVSIALGTVVTNAFDVSALGDIDLSGGVSAGSLSLASELGSANLAGGTSVSGLATIAVGQGVTTDDIGAGALDITAGGDVATGALQVGDTSIGAAAIAIGAVTGNSLQLSAVDAITLTGAIRLTDAFTVLKSSSIAGGAAIDANSLAVTSAGNAAFGNLAITNAANLTLGGDLAAGAATVGSLTASLGGSATLASLASAGTVDIATVGPIAIAGDLSGTAVTLSATTDAGSVAVGGATDIASLDITANGPIGLGAVTATGLVQLTTGIDVTAGAISADTVTIVTSDGASLASVTTNGDASITGIGPIAIANDLAAGGAVTLTGGSISVAGQAAGNSLSATGGDIGFGALAITNAAVIDASGLLTVTGTTATGALTASGAGVTLHDLSISGTASIASDAGLTILAGGTIADTATLTAGTDLSVGGPLSAASVTARAGGAASFGQLEIGGLLQVIAGTTASFAGPITAGSLDLQAGGAITAGRIALTGAGSISGGSVSADRIDAAGLDLVSVGDATIAAIGATGDVTLLVGGQAGLGTVSAGSLSLTATDPAATVTVDSLSVAGTAVLRAANALTIGGGSAGALDAATSAGDLTLSGAFTATSAAELAAAGVVTVNGDLGAANIRISGGDFVLGNAARLGGAATASIQLVANANAGSVDVGGSGGSGFAVDAGELTRMRANVIAVDAGQASLGVHDVTLAGSAAVSPNLNGSLFELVSQGDIRVDGAIAIIDAGVDDTIRITAGGLLHVVRPTGSLAVTGSNGGLAGLIQLSAGDRVLVASDSARTAVDAATSLQGRRDILLVNDGPAAPQGVVRAAGVTLAAGNAIQVQNSNAPRADYAGIASGDRGLTLARLTNAAPGTVEVIGYGAGRVAGQPLTGFDYASAVVFTPGELAAGSQINNCVLGAPCRGSFQGDPTVAQGSVTFNRSETLDIISIGTATPTILNWTPYDANGVGTIDFLPAGNSGLFAGVPGLANFTVINRVLPVDPNRPVAINGNLRSEVTLNGLTAPGGTLVFYAPGGVLIGGTARLDVGSLLLTAADVTSFGQGSFGLDSAVDSRAEVGIDAGAVVNANAEGSFVALFGPRIATTGTMNVAGTVALVAAEAGTLTFNSDSTFDIALTRGTALPSGDLSVGPITRLVDIGGSIGGPQAGAGGGRSLVVAMAPRAGRAQARVTGDLGWATGVGARPSQLLFAAGVDAVGVSGGVTMASSLGGVADVFLTAAGAPTVLRGDVVASASRSVIAGGTAEGVQLLGDLSSRAAFGTTLDVAAGGLLQIDGDVTADIGRGGPIGRSLFQLVTSSGSGRITIAGNVTADAPAYTLAEGATVAGGVAFLDANGGSISIGGNLGLRSNGAGGFLGQSLPGSGGIVSVNARNGGSVAIGGAISLIARGEGSDAGAPGVIRGGFAGVFVNGNSSTQGSLFIDVSAVGSAVTPTATGGDVTLASESPTPTNNFADITILASANGPGSNRGGTVDVGAGDTGTFFVRAGTLQVRGAGLQSTVDTSDVVVDGDISIAPDVVIRGSGTISAGGQIAAANLSGAALAVTAAGPVTTGVLSGDTVQVTSSAGAVTIGGASATGDLALAASGDLTVTGALTAGRVTAASGGDARFLDIGSSGGVAINAGGALTAASITGTDLVLTAGSSATLAALTGSSLVLQSTAGDLGVSGAIVLTGAAQLTAAGALTAASIDADSLDLQGNSVSLGMLGIAGPATVVAANGVVLASGASIGGAADISAGSDLVVGGDLDAGSLAATIGGTAQFAGIATIGPVRVQAANSLAISGDVQAGQLDLTATTGALDIGGAITAGAASLTAGGDVSVAGRTSVTSLVATAGGQGRFADITASGRVGLVMASALLGGPLSASGFDATLSGGDFTAQGPITTGVATITANGLVTLDAAVTATSLSVSGGGDLQFAGLDVGQLDLVSRGGAITLTQGARVTDAANLTAAQGLTVATPVTTASLTADAGADVQLGQVSASGAVDIAGQAIAITGPVQAGSLTVDAATLRFGDRVDVDGTLTLNSGGDLSALAVSAQDLVLTATGSLNFDRLALASADITTTGSFTVAGTSTVTGALGVTAGGNVGFGDRIDAASVAVTSGGAVATAAVVTPGGASFTGRSLTLGRVSAASLLAQGSGPVALTGAVTANRMQVTATGTQGLVTVAAPVTAAQAILVNADRQVIVNGNLSAPGITIDASDVAIAADIGGAQTGSITLRTSAAKASSATIGGSGGAGGFEIDANELLRLRADSILIDTGFGTGGPSVTVAGFTVQGPTAARPNLNASSMTIASGGDLLVTGLAAIDNAASADVLSLLASGDIRVLVDNGGGALVRDASGALTGQLYLLGQRIVAARADGLAAVDAGLSGEALRSALATNSGSVLPEGYLQASRISVRAASDLLMQNVGGNAVYAGLTVGSGGFDIRQGSLGQRPPGLTLTPTALDQLLVGNGQVRVIAFGRQLVGQQTLVNAAFLPVVQVSASAVTVESEIDGCNIATGTCRSALADGPPMERIEMLTDMVVRPATDTVIGATDEDDDGSPADEATEHTGDGKAPPILPIMETRFVDPLAPLINGDVPEPAGGAGNEAVWTSEAGVNDLLDAGAGVGNEGSTVINPSGGGRGGGSAALGGGGGGGSTTGSVGSERNPGTTGADQGGNGGGGSNGTLPGGSGGSTTSNSVGSERNPGNTGADQSGGSASNAGTPGGNGGGQSTSGSVGTERSGAGGGSDGNRPDETPPKGGRP